MKEEKSDEADLKLNPFSSSSKEIDGFSSASEEAEEYDVESIIRKMKA
ncbi:MAG: hypothetical protein ACKO96_33835 [Flammeovirgaceae bacterium]